MPAAKKTAAPVETLVEDAQKAATETMDKVSKSMDEVVAFAQDNFDAVTKSAEIAAKAAEGINAEVVAFAKKSVEDGVAASKQFAEIKSAPEFVERQTEIAKSVFEGYVAQATKMSEMTMAAMQDISAPMQARAEAAANLAKTLRA